MCEADIKVAAAADDAPFLVRCDVREGSASNLHIACFGRNKRPRKRTRLCDASRVESR